MEARYARNLPALSQAQCDLLRTKRVAVIGCGGLGGHLIELMGRVGIGAITAVDGDVFDETNLNRQLLSQVPLLGTSKAEAAAARMAAVNPDVSITAHAVFLTEENACSLLAGCHAVLDGLDSIAARRVLYAACEKLGIPCIHGAIGGWAAQAAIAMPGDGLLDRLYPAGAVIKGKSVLSFTPALCAAVQASLCVRLLAGLPVKTGVLYYYDLLSQELESIPLT